jgi:hypothetical protein
MLQVGATGIEGEEEEDIAYISHCDVLDCDIV